jgi:hypothetical protein
MSLDASESFWSLRNMLLYSSYRQLCHMLARTFQLRKFTTLFVVRILVKPVKHGQLKILGPGDFEVLIYVTNGTDQLYA